VLLVGSASGATLPDFVPVTIRVPSPLTAPPNPEVTIAWGVANRGLGTALVTPVDYLYVASNGVPDSAATFVSAVYENVPISPGTTNWTTNTVVLPITSSGSYSLILLANYSEPVSESNYGNDRLAVSFNFQSTPADLAPMTLLLPAGITGSPNPSVTIVYAVTNRGAGLAEGTWNDMLYLSTNTNFDPTQPPLVVNNVRGPLARGGTYWQTNVVSVPVTTDGVYHMSLVVDGWNELFESQTNNNRTEVPVTFHILPPDLALLELDLPPIVTSPPDPTLQIVYAVTNAGPGAATAVSYWDNSIYLSTSPSLNSNAVLMGVFAETNPIAPGEVSWQTNQVQVPVHQSGSYYLIVSLDPSGDLAETNKTNNILAAPVTFYVQQPDLTPIIDQVPRSVTGPPNPILELTWGITNRGVGAALGAWTERVVFSSDPSPPYWWPGSWDTDNGPLLPGETKWHSDTLQVPVLQSGTYNVEFIVDDGGNLYESDENNNRVIVPITFEIQPVDLSMVVVSAPSNISSGPNPVISVTWSVTNLGIASLSKAFAWSDEIHFSADPAGLGFETRIWSGSSNGPLEAGGSYTRTADLTLPALNTGTNFLIFVTDAQNTLVESNETNNVVAVPVFVNIVPTIRELKFLPSGNLQLAVYGIPGSSLSLEVSTNLSDWAMVLPFQCTNNPTLVIDPVEGISTARFYRIR
jgi:subtilase family serine protease